MERTRTDRDRFARELVASYRRRRDRGEAEPLAEFLSANAELRDLLEAALHEDPAGADTLPASPRGDAPAGVVLGDFRIVREIGRGGMGVVYEAEQFSLSRKVALKVLPAHLTLRPSAIERFRREAATAAKLRHPNIVEIHSVGDDAGMHYFAMSFVEGTPLGLVLDRVRGEPITSLHGRTIGAAVSTLAHRPTPPHPVRESAPPGAAVLPAAWSKGYIETVVDLVARVADALEHAHAHGVVHRDVKPSNILVCPDGTPVLTDFGLAREEGLASMTLTGEFAGTPYYVSPEQAMAKRVPVDHRTDVFSLGVTLFELLTRRRPFEGDTVQEVLARILAKEPPDPQKLNPRLAPDLATIVLKAIEKDPDRRYANAAAFASDLRAFLEYRPIAARRASGGERLLRWARREPAKAGLAAALLLGIPTTAALGGYLLARLPDLRAAAEQARADRIESALEEGYLRLGEGKRDEAVADFRRALSIDAGCPEGIAGIALALVDAGRSEEALRFLDEHRAAVERHRALGRARAAALRASDREPEADALENALGYPRDALDLFISGVRELRQGERGDATALARALALLTQASLTSPRARALHHFERIAAAGRARDVATARAGADAIEALWPASRAAWARIGAALAEIDPRRAIDAYRRLVAMDPLDADATRRLGETLGRSGDLLGAIAALRRALELRPNDPQSWLALGNALADSGDLSAAIAELRRCVEAHPANAVAHNDLGVALHEAGDLEGAADRFRRALQMDPRLAVALENLGNVLSDLGDEGDALAAFRRIPEIQPENARAHNDLGFRLYESGDLAGAIACFHRALEIDAGLLRAHYNLGNALFDSGLLYDAAAAYRRILEIDSAQTQALDNLALALRQLGNLRGAEDACRRALAVDPRDSAAHSLLVAVLQDRGDLEETRMELERWTAVRPSDPDAWNDLAWYLVDPQAPLGRRDPAAGLAAARRAVELSKNRDLRILDTLAEALFAAGEAAAAVEVEEQALAVLDRASEPDEELRAALDASLARFRDAAAASGRAAPDQPDLRDAGRSER